MRARFLALALAACAAAAGCDGPSEAVEDEAVVVFVFQGHPEDTMRVLVRRRDTIEAARRYLRSRAGANIPSGPLVRGAGVDPRYPMHFIPDSVRLVEVAIELCDHPPMHTPEEVDEFFEGSTGRPDAPRAKWCPWNARPIAVERP
jgi:hypothetical protein